MIRLRKLAFALILFFILAGCQGSYDQLDQAYELHSTNKYNEALRELQKVKSTYNQTQLVYKEASLFEGQIYQEMDSLLKAERSYQETLVKEKGSKRIVRKLKKRILDLDPKLQLEYEANLNLAKLYCKQGFYEKSMKYLHEADKRSDFFSCGQGIIEMLYQRESLLVSNYLGMRKIESILEQLRGEIFKEKDSSRIEEISDLLREEYSDIEIQNSLSIALTSINRKELIDEFYPTEYSMTWFGREVIFQDIEIQDYQTAIDSTTGRPYLIKLNDEESIKLCQEKIKESKIYRELEK